MSSDKSVSDIPNIRDQVDKLLKEASSQKLLRHQTQEALIKLRKADELIDKYALPEPWPSLCAYRLAHLLLRTASNKEELKEASLNFSIAKGSQCLGPLPAIYSLAVLYRLKSYMPANSYQERIEGGFRIAKEAIQQFNMQEDPQLQDHTFNLLELATYFSGLDYDDLEGIGFSHKPLSSPSAWILVGPDPQWSSVMRSKPEALEELNELMKMDEYKDAVFFKLSDKDSETNRPLKRHWKHKKGDWDKTSYQCLRLLALLLQQPTCPLDVLSLKVVGEDATFNALFQIKRRLKNALALLTGRSENDIYDPSFNEFPKINPQIPIFGAVEISTLHLEKHG